MRSPALIFDFGNVVAHFDYGLAATKLGRRLGLSGSKLLARLASLGFSDLLKTYESGQISAEDFSRGVAAMVGLTISHDEFQAAWSDIFRLNESLAPHLGYWKRQGYTLVLGSNTNDLHARQFRRQFAEPLEHFDRLILSYEVGHIKPSGDFYRACARAANQDVGDCVFVDDLPENVEGARNAGLIGVVYTSTEALLDEFRGLGIDIPAKDSP